MNRQQRITKLLGEALHPLRLEVEDESARHAGHAGARPEGETHYALTLVAESFRGLNRVARHRKVQHLLQPEFDAGLHALRLKLLTPEEDASQ